MGQLIQNVAVGFLKSESGATAIEYGFLIALLALVLVVALQSIGTSLATIFNRTAGFLTITP